MRSDLISRQAAIDAIDVLCQEHRYKIPGKPETYSQYSEAWQDAMDRAENEIWNLPSAEPERKRGKWTDRNLHWHTAICSNCNKVTMFEEWDEKIVEYDFCPNCGADMRERENER